MRRSSRLLTALLLLAACGLALIALMLASYAPVAPLAASGAASGAVLLITFFALAFGLVIGWEYNRGGSRWAWVAGFVTGFLVFASEIVIGAAMAPRF
jgi:hypothetical protein